jgi:hypothetical protein
MTTTVVTALPITMACWFVTDESIQTRYLMSLGGASGDVNLGLLAGTNGGNNVRASSQSSGINVDQAVSLYAWPNTVMRKPFHAAAVFASTTSRTAYLNGIPGAANTASNSPNFASLGTTFFGGRWLNGSASSQGFNGRAWWFAMWRAALSPLEIRLLSMGWSPLQIRRAALVHFVPGDGDYRDYARGSLFTPTSVDFWQRPPFPTIRPTFPKSDIGSSQGGSARHGPLVRKNRAFVVHLLR